MIILWIGQFIPIKVSLETGSTSANAYVILGCSRFDPKGNQTVMSHNSTQPPSSSISVFINSSHRTFLLLVPPSLCLCYLSLLSAPSCPIFFLHQSLDLFLSFFPVKRFTWWLWSDVLKCFLLRNKLWNVTSTHRHFKCAHWPEGLSICIR